MLFSIIPPETVFHAAGGEAPVWEEVDLGGARRVLVQHVGAGRVVVVRVISTEPRDYLDPALQPGQPFHR